MSNYLGIRTDSPLAEMHLFKDRKLVASDFWQADRELAHGLLGRLEMFLQQNNITFEKLTGVFVYKGPGSFTGLRIGITVMNTISYAESIPIVGTDGADWLQDAIHKLEGGSNDEIILPLYGADARITKPKK